MGVCLILLLLLRVGKEVFSIFFADFMSHIVILEFYKTDCIGNVLVFSTSTACCFVLCVFSCLVFIDISFLLCYLFMHCDGCAL